MDFIFRIGVCSGTHSSLWILAIHFCFMNNVYFILKLSAVEPRVYLSLFQISDRNFIFIFLINGQIVPSQRCFL